MFTEEGSRLNEVLENLQVFSNYRFARKAMAWLDRSLESLYKYYGLKHTAATTYGAAGSILLAAALLMSAMAWWMRALIGIATLWISPVVGGILIVTGIPTFFTRDHVSSRVQTNNNFAMVVVAGLTALSISSMFLELVPINYSITATMACLFFLFILTGVRMSYHSDIGDYRILYLLGTVVALALAAGTAYYFGNIEEFYECRRFWHKPNLRNRCIQMRSDRILKELEPEHKWTAEIGVQVAGDPLWVTVRSMIVQITVLAAALIPRVCTLAGEIDKAKAQADSISARRKDTKLEMPELNWTDYLAFLEAPEIWIPTLGSAVMMFDSMSHAIISMVITICGVLLSACVYAYTIKYQYQRLGVIRSVFSDMMGGKDGMVVVGNTTELKSTKHISIIMRLLTSFSVYMILSVYAGHIVSVVITTIIIGAHTMGKITGYQIMHVVQMLSTASQHGGHAITLIQGIAYTTYHLTSKPGLPIGNARSDVEQTIADATVRT